MYRYKYDTSYHHKSRRARRVGVFAFLLLVSVVSAGGYVAYDMFKQNINTKPVASQPTFSSVQGATVNLFRTAYFQFQADQNWREVETETKDGSYRYRSFKGSLIEKDLLIEVNKDMPEVLPLMRTTRVLPVDVDAAGRLNMQGGAGTHCKEAMPKGSLNIPTPIVDKQVSFVCTPDAVVYEVAVGVIGGSTNMLLPRPDGTKATYRITYRDFTVSPTDLSLRTIIETFQTR